MNSDLVQAVVRSVTSIIIALAFLLVLVVATSQQQSISALKSANIDQNYSVARQTVDDAESASEKVDARDKKLAELRNKLGKLEDEKDQLGLELYSRMQDVANVARTIARSGRCPLLTTSPNPTIVPGPEVWDTVRDCAEDGKIPPAASSKLTELLEPGNNPAMLKRGLDRLDRDIRRSNRDVQAKEAEILRLRETVTKSDKVSNALQDLRVLDEFGAIRITGLTWVPPGLMQILLCFVSGLFGALLLTLILAVYPENDFDFVKSQSYWKRIFLGGLIAVAVYVVIGSSVAVLGSDRALIEDANVLSYTAIGILAGMFSERVARFLSSRGNVFAGGQAGQPPAGNQAPGGKAQSPNKLGPADNQDHARPQEPQQ